MVVVGATDKAGSFGCRAAQSAIKGSNGQRVYFLNPKREELFGRRCYPDLASLPEVVDCMVLCPPAATVTSYLEEGGRLGIGAAVVYASGFGEERSAASKQMEAEITRICETYQIALMGPNCVGFINALDGICTFPGDRGILGNGVKRGMGVVAQSGYATGGCYLPDAKRLAFVISAGNCAAVSLEDYLLFYAGDPRITCIAAYIEGIKKPAQLEKALRLCAENRKPVVALKAGMSEKGSFAAASHTGSLAGDYKSFEAVCAKYGVILTRSLQEFHTTARMFAVLDGHLPQSAGVGAINFSGAENTLCADTCARFGIDLPAFAPETAEAIAALVPAYSTPANPLDATTTLFTEKEKVKALFTAISRDPSVGIMTLGNDVGLPAELKDATCREAMAELRGEGELAPLLIMPSYEKTRDNDMIAAFEDIGIPVLATGDLAYRALRHLCDFIAYNSAERTLSLALPQGDSRREGRVTLSEFDSKEALSAAGVPVPRQARAADEAALERCLPDFPGAVVLKVDSADIPHKTEAGGVKLNLRTPEEAKAAFREIMTSCRAYKPDAQIDGVLVQEMARPGVEIILGVKNDKQFGPMLLAGLGGVFVEVFQDAALYPCPLGLTEAKAMLESLKGYRLLSGYRGGRPCDIEALAALMVSASDYAAAHRDTLSELDLNPVFVYEEGQGVMAADALIVNWQ